MLVVVAGCSDELAGDPRAREAVVEAVRAMGDPEPATMELSLPDADAEVHARVLFRLIAAAQAGA